MRTGSWVALVGSAVSLLGWRAVRGRAQPGVIGFGLAHVLLGLIDSALRRKSPVR